MQLNHGAGASPERTLSFFVLGEAVDRLFEVVASVIT